MYILKECGIVECDIRSTHRVNLLSNISSWISSASAQQKLSVSVSICQQLLHLHYSEFPIRLLLDDCCRTFPSESLSSLFEEARGSKEYSTNLLGSLQPKKLSISELLLSVSLSVTLDILENHRFLLCFCVIMLILLKKNCFLNVAIS